MRGAGRPELEAHFSKRLAPGEPLWCVAYGVNRKQGWDALIDLAILALDSDAIGARVVDEGFAFGLTPQRLLVARAKRVSPALSLTLDFELQPPEIVLASALRGADVTIETKETGTFVRGRFGAAEVDVVFREFAAFPDSGKLGAELARRIKLALG